MMTTNKRVRKAKKTSTIYKTNNFVNNCRVFGKTVRAEFMFPFHKKKLYNFSFLVLNIHNLEKYEYYILTGRAVA